MSERRTASPSTEKLKFRLSFSCVITATALGLTWLLLADSSPFHDYFTRRDELPDVWTATMFIPFAFSAIISGNPHSPPMAIVIFAFTVQWFLFGLLISGPIFELKSRFRKR